MKTIKILWAFIFIGLVAVSCKDDEPAAVNKEKAEASFTSANDAVAADITAMMESPGYKAMNSLSALNSTANPFGRLGSVKPTDIGGQVKSILTSLRATLKSSVENGKTSGDEPFIFDETTKGVYTYNPETEQFAFAAGGDIIKILFPTEGSSTNNAVFELTAYDEEVDDFGYYNATLVEASVTIDGTLQAEIDMTASYDSYGETTKTNVHLYLNPYTVVEAFDNTSATSTTVAFSLAKGTTVIINAAITVTYTSKATGEMSRITGFVQLMNIRFEADVTQNNIVVTIKIDGANAGKIIQDETTGEPYVQYNDGSSVPFEDVFGDLTVQLDGL